VLYAYDQLATEGLVTGTPRGTVVAPVALGKAMKAHAPSAGAAVARRTQSLRSLPASGDAAGAFAPGVPALDAFPIAAWRRLIERAWRGIGAAELNYADVAGIPALREQVRNYVAASRGVRCEPEQVFITSSTQTSMEICARAFADAGATCWMENPGYIGALAAFRGAQLRTIGVAVDAEGILPTSRDWQQHPPKLIYTTPSHQYPVGGVLGLNRRLALLENAASVGALIIEDDYDSEFRYDGPPLPAMQGLVENAPVIYLGTFSKTVFPAVRTGYMVVPQNLVEPLRALVSRMAPHGRVADQMALAEYLGSGQFGVHLRRMRRLYRARRDATVDALHKHMGGMGALHGQTAGMHLSLQLLDATRRDTAIAAAALEQGIVLRALSAHSTGLREHGWNGLVFGYSQVDERVIEGLIRRVAKVVAAG
jgi:GntR family transcriptional regulator / MocR family aminotransferase